MEVKMEVKMEVIKGSKRAYGSWTIVCNDYSIIELQK